MMKRALVLAALVAACEPINWDSDIDLGLAAGPIPGDHGVATFAFVDGCPTSDWLTGCAKTMPAFAVGARARFVVGAVSQDVSAQKRVEQALLVSDKPSIVGVARDADGFVVMQAFGHGSATIELRDRDGDVIDSILVRTQPVAWLAGDTNTTILDGARIGAKVVAKGSGGEVLYARGAVTATLGPGLELDADNGGFFTASEQVAIRGTASGETLVRFSAGNVSLDVPYTVVSRDEISEVNVFELGHEAGANKQRLFAMTKAGTDDVRGGPACDWRIVSGGGSGAALAAGAGNDTQGALFTLYDEALVYGEGDMTVECRVNSEVIGEYTVHLGP